MNLYVLTRTMKIGFLYDGHPLQGLTEVQRCKDFFYFNHQFTAAAFLQGRRYPSYLNNKKSIISAPWMNTTIFIENAHESIRFPPESLKLFSLQRISAQGFSNTSRGEVILLVPPSATEAPRRELRPSSYLMERG